MQMRGVRGAISVEENTAEAILEATETLLEAIMSANEIETTDIASAFFTLTPDLNAVFPAVAARKTLGWTTVPLLCASEIAVPDATKGLLRVLLHWNTDKTQTDIQHIYLGEAKKLRPDIAQQQEVARQQIS